MTQFTLEETILAGEIHKAVMVELAKVGKHGKNIEKDFNITVLALAMTCCAVMQTYGVNKKIAPEFMDDLSKTVITLYDAFEENSSVMVCKDGEVKYQGKPN